MKKTVVNMLREAAINFEKCLFLNEKDDSGYFGKTFKEVDTESDYIATALINLGFKKEDKIAILSEGRIDWVIGEFGITKAHCISVPLSVKLLPEEILFRLNHSGTRAILVSKNYIEKILPILSKIIIEDFRIIYLEKNTNSISDLLNNAKVDAEKTILLIDKLREIGRTAFFADSSILANIEHQIDENDVVTICYTSGTTGNPKGIMLTHLNYHSNSTDAMTFFNVPDKYRLMIILPLDHSFAHTVGTYASLIKGLALYFVDARGGGMAAIKNIPINLKEANPHFMLTVPALTGNFLNKIVDGIESKGGFVKWLFKLGLKCGRNIFLDGHEKPSFVTVLLNRIPYFLANKLIFSKLRQIFGSNLQYCVGGGALLDIRQQRFFYSIGIPIYQGYGLTEATPIISANTPKVHKLGSSGKVLPFIQYKIVKSDGNIAKQGEKGELVIKGKNVMKGYYKNEEATKDALRDGWLYTGDMAYMDKDDFLIVVGREKALLISEDGEKYSPEEIEEAIVNCSPLIGQVMIHNDHNRFTSALATLDKNHVENFIKNHNIKEPEKLLESIKSSFYLFRQTHDFKAKFPEKWVPSAFRIIEEPFSEQNLMINSTLKMVRFKIKEVYQNEIDFIYSPEGSNTINQRNLDSLIKLFYKK